MQSPYPRAMLPFVFILDRPKSATAATAYIGWESILLVTLICGVESLELVRGFDTGPRQTAIGVRGKWGESMDSIGRPLMPNPEEYRQYAKLCDGLANSANDKIERGALLQIANHWRRIANHRVKREREDAEQLMGDS